MTDAAFRRPPFSAGENEKGFRDALVAEAARQLIASSPSAASECRIVVVTADELLAKAITIAARNRDNVMVLPSIAELKGFIATFSFYCRRRLYSANEASCEYRLLSPT